MYEYIGTQPQGRRHGNSLTNTQSYRRTDPAIIQSIKQTVQDSPHLQPRQIYENMVLQDLSNAPRDLKQVDNTRYRFPEQRQHHVSFADQTQGLITEMQANPHIHSVQTLQGSPPLVVMCPKQAIQEMNNITSEHRLKKLVLGFDRTFNLSSAYLTTIVYKHPAVLRKTTNEPPIVLGPAYLHWDGSYQSYYHFLSQIKGNLAGEVDTIEVKLENVVFGSDEEKALRKAIHAVFPMAKTILCSKHIKDNCVRHLQTLKVSPDDVTRIQQTLFDKDTGLVSCNRGFEFDLAHQQIRNEITHICPEFVPYLEKMVEKIKLFSWKPHVQGIERINWTNNNCESMNNILKLKGEFRPRKLPILVKNISELYEMHNRDVERSVYGEGNYILSPEYSKFYVEKSLWLLKTPEQREGHLRKLLAYIPNGKRIKPEVISKTVTSSDGKLTVTNPKRNVAKKPGQRTRPRSTRATSKR